MGVKGVAMLWLADALKQGSLAAGVVALVLMQYWVALELALALRLIWPLLGALVVKLVREGTASVDGMSTTNAVLKFVAASFTQTK